MSEVEGSPIGEVIGRDRVELLSLLDTSLALFRPRSIASSSSRASLQGIAQSRTPLHTNQRSPFPLFTPLDLVFPFSPSLGIRRRFHSSPNVSEPLFDPSWYPADQNGLHVHSLPPLESFPPPARCILDSIHVFRYFIKCFRSMHRLRQDTLLHTMLRLSGEWNRLHLLLFDGTSEARESFQSFLRSERSS